MAITRAQQFKQMLAQGGRIGFQGGGRDASKGDFGGPSGPGPGDDGDRREQRSVATTQGISPTTQSALGIDRSKITNEQNRLNAIRALENYIDRPLIGFTDAARFNITPPGLRGLFNTFTGPDRIEPDDFGRSGISILPFLFPRFQQGSQTMKDEEEDEEDKNLRKLKLAFRAEGGSMNDQIRQAYGLGSIVKKATRAVKKVAKSDLGKAAILGALTFGIPGVETGFFSKGLSGTKFGLGAKKFLFGAPGVPGVPDFVTGGGTKGILGGLISPVGAAIVGTSVLAGLMTPKQEAQAQALANDEGIDIEAARRSIIARAQGNVRDDYRMLSARAEGGRIGYQEGSKEPVAKKTMPLLNMGGKEMDLREEGGFVPIGRMEKADDVPARLSKNEFVFTADAVRNAGEGDVDKGAEVMYNMMKNLEVGGEVSEESQGLEGARKMFQTSQRLEEVL